MVKKSLFQIHRQNTRKIFQKQNQYCMFFNRFGKYFYSELSPAYLTSDFIETSFFLLLFVTPLFYFVHVLALEFLEMIFETKRLIYRIFFL